MSPKSKAEAIKKQLIVINELLKKPENKYCADCKKTSPTWASVNLGVFVCINCSGCHREIGVHITKIRSVNLDVWPKEILNNFKLINNQIANKYWECKLKKFDFKKIQNDKYKLVEFIRNKYENKNWIDTSKKVDPMTLISKGKIKKFKKLYCQDDDEEEENEEQEKNEKKNKGKKNKKLKNHSDNEEEDEDNDDEEDKSESDNDKKNNKGKKNNSKKNEESDNEDEEENEEEDNNKNNKNIKKKKIPQETKAPITQRNPQVHNLFSDLNDQNGNNNNQPQQNLLNLNDNQNQNNNIMDLFNSGSSNNLSNLSSNNIIRPQNNMNLNINRSNSSNLYFSPQPMHSGGLNNIFQQMPINNKLNLQKNNNMNMGINNNNMMNINKMNSMQNLNSLNNNMMNLNLNNNINLGMNNNLNNMNNFNNNNMNNINNYNFNNSNMNNMNQNNKPIQNNTNASTTTNNNPISFNMDYFNKNMESKKSNEGSTYNFKKNKVDPFANLVSFKK